MRIKKLIKRLVVVTSASICLAGFSIGGIAVNEPVAAYAEDSDFVISGGVLTSYKGEGGDVVIPSGVKVIADYVFKDKNVTSVVIPEGVTMIGEQVFRECNYLSSVTLPSTLTSIGARAFCECTNLEAITCPESLKTIGDEAFAGCSKLSKAVLRKGLTSLGYRAFYNCKALSRILIPSTLRSMGNSVFYNCTSLEEVIIKSTNLSLSDYVFLNCESIKTVTISEGVKSIGTQAFMNCSSLEEVVFPASLIEIGEEAFVECSSLTHVTFSEGIEKLGENVFKGDDKIKEITIPASLKTIGASAFKECTAISKLTLTNGNLSNIGEYAFYGCSGITELSIPSSVESIGECAFYGCSGINSLKFSKGLKTIGNEAFRGCTSLVNLNIPYGVETIGEHSFWYCSKLKRIQLTTSIKYIGYEAFMPYYYYFDNFNGDFYFTGSESKWKEILFNSAENIGFSDEVKTYYNNHFPGEHSYVTVKAKDATCTTDGNTAGKQCRICGEYADGAKCIPALGHKEKSSTVTKTATYAEEGSKNCVCSVCGKTYTVVLPRKTLAKAVINSAANTSAGIKVCWNKVTGAKGYYLYKNGTKLVKLSADTLSYEDKQVEKGKKYTYTIKSFAGTNVSAVSAGKIIYRVEATGVTKVTQSSEKGVNGLTVRWKKYYGNGYSLYRSTDGGSFTKIKDITDANTVTYTDTAVAAGHKYQYKVKAYKRVGDVTSYAVFGAGKTYYCVGFVKELKCVNVSTGIKLTWTKNSYANGYEIYRRDGNDSTFRMIKEYTDNTKVAMTDTDVINGHKYYYYIRAYKNVNSEKYISVGTALVQYYRLTDVDTVSVEMLSSGVKVSWTRNNAASMYKLYRSTDGSKYSLIRTLSGDALSFLDKDDKTNGSVYYYKIIEVKENSQTLYSSAGKVKSFTYLTAPTISGIENSTSGVKLTWTKNASATGYVIYRKQEDPDNPNANEEYVRIKTITANTTLTYTDKAANVHGVKYSYRITAYKGSVQSSNSTMRSIEYKAKPVITSLTNSAASTITVKWNSIEKASYYKIYYMNNAFFKTTKGTEIVIERLKKGEKYTVTVEAVFENRSTSESSAARSITLTK